MNSTSQKVTKHLLHYLIPPNLVQYFKDSMSFIQKRTEFTWKWTPKRKKIRSWKSFIFRCTQPLVFGQRHWCCQSLCIVDGVHLAAPTLEKPPGFGLRGKKTGFDVVFLGVFGAFKNDFSKGFGVEQFIGKRTHTNQIWARFAGVDFLF